MGGGGGDGGGGFGGNPGFGGPGGREERNFGGMGGREGGGNFGNIRQNNWDRGGGIECEEDCLSEILPEFWDKWFLDDRSIV